MRSRGGDRQTDRQTDRDREFSRISFSSGQDDIYALRKAHVCSTPSLRSFPSVGFETVVRLIDNGPLVLSRKVV